MGWPLAEEAMADGRWPMAERNEGDWLREKALGGRPLLWPVT
jgi:hypothetical protein